LEILRHAAFSEFVSALSRTSSLDALSGALSSKLKYVVDACLWQLVFFGQNETILYEHHAGRVRFSRTHSGPLAEYTRSLLREKIPVRLPAAMVSARPAFTGSIFTEPELTELLAVPVVLYDTHLCALVGSDSSFTGHDLKFTRLLGEHVARRIEHFLAVEKLEQHAKLLEQSLVTIRAQREELMQLSAPVIEVWDGVEVLPLIGSMDGERIDKITSKVFTSLQHGRTDELLIDLTGVLSLDVQALLQFIRGVGLLGTRCSLVGIKPELALKLVEVMHTSVDVATYVSLRDGLQAAIGRIGAESSPRR